MIAGYAAGAALGVTPIFVPACGIDTSGAQPVELGADASTADAASDGAVASDAGSDGTSTVTPACATAADCTTKYCASGTCAVAPSCKALLDAAPTLPSGGYVVARSATAGGAPLAVYCDMEHDGGGWLLAAKAHRHHAGFASYVQPHDWLSTESDVNALIDETSYENRLPGVASLGRESLAHVAEVATLARFTLVAENAPLQRVSWFKATTPDLFTWFTATTTQTASTVCSDVAMTAHCSQGRIAYVKGACLEATCMEGMSLSAFGFAVKDEQTIHMRLLGDKDDTISGVCSYTFDDPTWADSDNQHWGNGLLIWLR